MDTANPFDAFNANPFEPQPLDEARELRVLARNITMALGFGLLFVQCSQSELRERLMHELELRLPDKKLFRAPIREPVMSLMHTLAERLDALTEAEKPDAVFVYGLEAWLPARDEEPGARFVPNLNIFRNDFRKYVPCLMLMWLSEHLLRDIQDRAPDFFSVRSGIYAFAAPATETEPSPPSLAASEEIGFAGLSLEDKQERIENLRNLLTGFEALPEARRDPNTEAGLLHSLILVYQVMERYDDMEQAIARLTALTEKFTYLQPQFGWSIFNQKAVLRYRQGHFEEAETLFQNALTTLRSASPPNPGHLADVLNNLAALYYITGYYDKAEPLHEEALRLRRAAIPPDSLAVAQSLNNLAQLYFSAGRTEQVEPMLLEALTLRRSLLPKNHPDIAHNLNVLAMLCTQSGRYKEAETLYREALSALENTLGTQHRSTAQIATNYATLMLYEERTEEALALLTPFPGALQNFKAFLHAADTANLPHD